MAHRAEETAVNEGKDIPEAQWVDEVRGIGMVTAVSLLAHIGNTTGTIEGE